MYQTPIRRNTESTDTWLGKLSSSGNHLKILNTANFRMFIHIPKQMTTEMFFTKQLKKLKRETKPVRNQQMSITAWSDTSDSDSAFHSNSLKVSI